MNIDDMIREANKFMNDKLEAEYTMNSIEINILSRKIQILKATKTSSRLAYIAGLTLTSFLVNVIVAHLIGSTVNIWNLVAVFGTSVALEGIKYLSEGNIKKLREFSSSKTDKEKDQEQSMYENKKQELLTRNRVISAILDSRIFEDNEFETYEVDDEESFTIEKINDENIEDYIIVDGRAVKQEYTYSESSCEEVVQEQGYQKVKSIKTP